MIRAESLLQAWVVEYNQPRPPAIAVVNGVQYIATWNFKHILNPTLQGKIALVCRQCGYEPPTICTPEQLLEAQDDS